MSKYETLSTLSTTLGLDSYGKKHLERLASLFDEAQIAAGGILTVEHQSARQCFLVVDGQAEVIIAGDRVNTVGSGEWVGEMAVLDNGRRTATVRAMTPMRVLAVGRRDFADLLELPGVARSMALGIARRIRQAEAVD